MIPVDAPAELLLTSEMGQADRLAIEGGTPGSALMERAGAAVAECVRGLVPSGRILAVCGPGNNGGDGFVAARRLAETGYDVDLALLGRIDGLRGDAAAAASAWGRPLLDLGALQLDRYALVVDALFGAGLSRPLEGEALALVSRIADWSRASRRPIVAVDVPSGVHGDDGQALGAELPATETVTFFRLKPGHLLSPGRELCGRIRLADIGVPESVLRVIRPKAFANGPALWRAAFPRPAVRGHKYDRGHAVAVSGRATHTGAARLAARAALRIGAGLVTLASPVDALAVNAASLTAVMLAAANEASDLGALLDDPRKNAAALGPGLGVGPRARELAAAALEPGRSRNGVVLDADALTSFAGAVEDLAKLARAASAPVVLTPHEGEFARLFASIPKDLSKLERARRAAVEVGGTVVLKGADTVVAEPSGRAAIGSLDAPWLATAGSGDVLSGMICGLLAQGMPAFEAACAAVHLHASAGSAFGPGLISEDLPEILPRVLAALLASDD
jgi:ADP-dependent NAD(P)H-hydrate dehydratase / NAD(P)H-hydrate epimerase